MKVDIEGTVKVARSYFGESEWDCIQQFVREFADDGFVTVETVGGDSIVGPCSGCSEIIFPGESYYSFGEDGLLCDTCLKARDYD